MMLPYGALHHAYIHTCWTLPMLARAKAPRGSRALALARLGLRRLIRPSRRLSASRCATAPGPRRKPRRHPSPEPRP